MKYDFFNDFNSKYGLDCAEVYSRLFKGVKFIPKTFSIVSDLEREKEFARVYVMDPTDKNNRITFYASIYKLIPNSYHIHDIYFEHNNVSYVISDIHIDEDGMTYKYECFNLLKVQKQYASKELPLPHPSEYKEKGIKPDFDGIGDIPYYFNNNIISYIIEKYTLEHLIDEEPSNSRVRS